MPLLLGVIVVGLLAVALLWAVITFNLLVRSRNRVDESWALIGVELQRRYELVPNLLAAVQGYADYERTVVERVAESRAAAVAATDPDARARADSSLTGALRSLFMVSEAYPELKTSEQFLALQDELALTEDRIAYARGFYNALVVEYETRRRSVPSKLVADVLRFDPRRSFEADVESRRPVGVELRDAAG